MSPHFLRPVLVAVLLALSTPAALAVNPDEMLADPALEARAREVSKELRCVVCQNENIDESNAELARDLRIIVRDRLVKGDSNEATIQYVVDRYGDYVLLKPPFKASTYALWFGPIIILLIAIGVAWRFYARPQTATDAAATAPAAASAAPPALTPAEERRLQKILADEDTAP